MKWEYFIACFYRIFIAPASTSTFKKIFNIKPLSARYISTIKQQDLVPQKKQKKIFEDKVYNSLIRVNKISSHSYASLYHRSFVLSANFVLLGISWINELSITHSIWGDENPVKSV